MRKMPGGGGTAAAGKRSRDEEELPGAPFLSTGRRCGVRCRSSKRGCALLPQKLAAHASPRPVRRFALPPTMQHLSQREVGAGAVAEAVGERRDRHGVACNLLAVGRLARPAEDAGPGAAPQELDEHVGRQAPRFSASRAYVLRFVGLAPVEQERRRARAAWVARMRDAVRGERSRSMLSRACAFVRRRGSRRATSTSTNSGVQIVSTRWLVADLLVERARVRRAASRPSAMSPSNARKRTRGPRLRLLVPCDPPLRS